MTRWLLPSFLALILAFPAYAQEEDMFELEELEFEDPALLPVPSEPSAAERSAEAAEQMRGARTSRGMGANLRGLDKITGKTRDLVLQNGESVTYGRLELRLGECRFPQNDPSSDAYAELTISDSSQNRTIFSGWMVASSPALSALDDARYDVWVISCSNA